MRSDRKTSHYAFARCVLPAIAASLILIANPVRAQESPLERGRYLFDSLLACRTCHDEPDGQRRILAGGARFAQDGGTTGAAPNITPDRDAGIGAWSDADIVRAIREGVRPDGSVIAPVMAFELYRRISDNDMRAIVAYLRSVPPANNVVHRTRWGQRFAPYGPPVDAVPEVPRTDKLRYGAYLAGPLGECIACHTPYDARSRPDYAHRLGAGGTSFEGPDGEAVAGNITPDRDTGLGAFSDAQIKTMIVAGRRPDRSRISPIMPHRRYANLKADDLDAVVAYLRSLPPIRNMVDK